MHDWDAYAMIVWSLLAIANPLGVIPFFIDLTRAQSVQWFDAVFLVLASLVVAAVVWGCLRLAERMSRALGTTSMNIVARLMGLILAAVAVEFIIGGIAKLLPGLAAVR